MGSVDVVTHKIVPYERKYGTTTKPLLALRQGDLMSKMTGIGAIQFADRPMSHSTRIANHDDDNFIMRDFFVEGKRGVVSSIFGTNDGVVQATNNYEDRASWQDVGLAACFMN
jgi:hypothetical protein